jgi:DNA polymerase III epsilon subunit-like protein
MIFDTETTGLIPFKNRDNINNWPYIVQLSYIVYDTETDVITSKYDNIIKMDDGIKIPIESSNIHHITDEMSKLDGIPIYEAIIQMFMDLQNVELIIAHNISFDISMITTEVHRLIDIDILESPLNEYNIVHVLKINKIISSDSFKNKLFCTMKTSKKMCNIITISKTTQKPYIKFPKLSELHFKLFDIEPSQLHNSFNDVLICLRCFYKLKYDVDICDKNQYIKSTMISIGIICNN